MDSKYRGIEFPRKSQGKICIPILEETLKILCSGNEVTVQAKGFNELPDDVEISAIKWDRKQKAILIYFDHEDFEFLPEGKGKITFNMRITHPGIPDMDLETRCEDCENAE